MNLVSGVIREIAVEDGIPIARVSVDGALMKVPLLFVSHAVVGDSILISSGVAISRLEDHQQSEDETDVSGHPGKDSRD